MEEPAHRRFWLYDKLKKKLGYVDSIGLIRMSKVLVQKNLKYSKSDLIKNNQAKKEKED